MPTNEKPPSSTAATNRIWLTALAVGLVLISWSYFDRKPVDMGAPPPTPSGSAPAQTPAP